MERKKRSLAIDQMHISGKTLNSLTYDKDVVKDGLWLENALIVILLSDALLKCWCLLDVVLQHLFKDRNEKIHIDNSDIQK